MDILDEFPEIKIGVSYKLNGKVLESMPGEIGLFTCIQLVFYLPGEKLFDPLL